PCVCASSGAASKPKTVRPTPPSSPALKNVLRETSMAQPPCGARFQQRIYGYRRWMKGLHVQQLPWGVGAGQKRRDLRGPSRLQLLALLGSKGRPKKWQQPTPEQ